VAQRQKIRPKVLVMTSTYPRWKNDHEPGFVHELSKRLIADFDVTVLCPHAPDSAAFEDLECVKVHRFRYAPAIFETLVNDGGIVTNLKKFRWKWILLPFFFAGLCWSTFRMIRRFQPHVIHAHWLIPQGIVLLFLKCIGVRVPPYLITCHGADLFALQSRPLTWLKRQVAQNAEAITVVSYAMKGELVTLGVPRERITVQSMGVDLVCRFAPDGEVRTDNKHQVLFVGRMVEKKGARYLIEAVPAIIQVFPKTVVRMVGFGPEFVMLKELAVKLGVNDSIDFTGPKSQEEVANFGRKSNVFVAPFVEAEGGDQEGLGLVLVEALGVGCAVVVTDIPAAKDVTQVAPDAVCVVKQRSSEEIAAAVVRVLKAPDAYRQGALMSRQRLIEKFDWASVANAYSNILSTIVPCSFSQSD
jgi:glycosyltransferase involved in cell wall biosynthesis